MEGINTPASNCIGSLSSPLQPGKACSDSNKGKLRVNHTTVVCTHVAPSSCADAGRAVLGEARPGNAGTVVGRFSDAAFAVGESRMFLHMGSHRCTIKAHNMSQDTKRDDLPVPPSNGFSYATPEGPVAPVNGAMSLPAITDLSTRPVIERV